MGINIDVGAAQYINLDIAATQQEGAIFLWEEGEGDSHLLWWGQLFSMPF